MRILDLEKDSPLENILLCLTANEASELKSALEDVLQKPKANHVHISDFEAGKEITICIYNGANSSFSNRVKKLIQSDE